MGFFKVRDNQKGFTLVEIMAVTAIIGLLTAMAVPQFLRTRVSANEVAAQANLKTLHTLTEDYKFVNSSYPVNLTEIQNFGTSTYGNNSITANPQTGGYFSAQGFRYDYRSFGNATSYEWIAMPDVPEVTGNRFFTVTEEGFLEEVSANYASTAYPEEMDTLESDNSINDESSIVHLNMN